MIGISGLARSGKDTLAKNLADIIKLNLGLEVKILSFADRIKDQMKDVISKNYNIDPYTENTEEKEIIRDILVSHGETMKKIYGPTIWADLIIEDIKKSKNKFFPIISDVRFDFEAEKVKENDGLVIHISKIGNKPPNEIEAKNDPLVQKVADICHCWPEYEPDNMEECKDHAYILWQMFNQLSKQWKTIYI
jgi:hypothetical protein